jgi:hypothetical protein
MSENIERLKRARELYQQEHYSEAAVLYHQLIDAAGNAPAQVKELWLNWPGHIFTYSALKVH